MQIRSLVLVLLATACSKQATPKAPAPVAAQPAAPASAPAATPPPADARVGVSEDLARQCQLQFENTARAPKFAYDEDDLLPGDRHVLEQVATCLTRGPLKGKAVQLVGRSDPRGTDEYNLGLGTRRAASVGAYLERLGVPRTQLATTTRGELDAAGVDETGWQADRRVDLELRP